MTAYGGYVRRDRHLSAGNPAYALTYKRRAHTHNQSQAHATFRLPGSIRRNTCCLLRVDNRKPDGHKSFFLLTCSYLFLRTKLTETDFDIFRCAISKTSGRQFKSRSRAHHNRFLFFSDIQRHRFTQLNRVLFAVNTDNEVRSNTGGGQ